MRDAGEPCGPVLEPRQYTPHPGKPEAFIERFDREFIR